MQSHRPADRTVNSEAARLGRHRAREARAGDAAGTKRSTACAHRKTGGGHEKSRGFTFCGCLCLFVCLF